MKYLLVAVLLTALVGCVKAPTQNTQVVDDRPGLTFELAGESAAGYELIIDGVSYGAVGQYRQGENLLRLVGGTHRIEVLNNGRSVLTQKVYLGAGTNRVIKVGKND